MPLSWEEFVGQLGQIPAFPGARCRGRWELVDATIHQTRAASTDDVDYARQAALQLCAICPALESCRAWLNALPHQGPLGVVAGRIEPKQRTP